MDKQIPNFLQPFLWSYDLSQIDTKKHKNIIIKNILDFGDKEATDWLLGEYSKSEIIFVIENSISSDWSKKSLNFWSIIFDINPKKEARF